MTDQLDSDQLAADSEDVIVSQILSADPKYFIDSMSTETKDRLIKDGIVKQIKVMIDAFNEEFTDVHFKFSFSYPYESYVGRSELGYMVGGYGKEYIDEEDEVVYRPEGLQYLYATGLTRVNVRIDFFWKRVCSLGCNHTTNRFYICNIPKMLDILAFYKVKTPVRQLVKMYIPDFFYDPVSV